jgi:hypothetical protein
MKMVEELRQTTAYQQGHYHWCPILPTLSQPEHEILTQNEVLLEPFVSRNRVLPRWHSDESEPHIAIVLSRLATVEYHVNYYRQITSAFRTSSGPLPLRILGQNEPKGGPLNDPQIVGTLPDGQYWKTLARSRVFFYEGRTVRLLHWSVWEAFAMGIPVVMLDSGYPAWALRKIVGSETCGPEFGIVQNFQEARDLLIRCLKDRSLALAIAQKQQPLANSITDRDRALCQYRERLHAILGPTGDDRNGNPFRQWARRILRIH